jgi:hypothetical protein
MRRIDRFRLKAWRWMRWGRRLLAVGLLAAAAALAAAEREPFDSGGRVGPAGTWRPAASWDPATSWPWRGRPDSSRTGRSLPRTTPSGGCSPARSGLAR